MDRGGEREGQREGMKEGKTFRESARACQKKERERAIKREIGRDKQSERKREREREREREWERERGRKREGEREKLRKMDTYITIISIVTGTCAMLLPSPSSTLMILRVHASSPNIFYTSTPMTLPIKSIWLGSWIMSWCVQISFVICALK
jgi:hypothetical protein